MLTINYYYLTITAFFFFQINFLVRCDYVKIPVGTIFGLALNPPRVFALPSSESHIEKISPHFLSYKREAERVVYHKLFLYRY